MEDVRTEVCTKDKDDKRTKSVQAKTLANLLFSTESIALLLKVKETQRISYLQSFNPGTSHKGAAMAFLELKVKESG